MSKLDNFIQEKQQRTEEWKAQNGNLVSYMPEQIDVVTEEELRRCSLLEHPQQVLAVFEQRVVSCDLLDVAKSDLCIMLDGVQNPGNLGTIVRLADWFGIENVFCSQDCADIYNPKTIQATMGGLARVNVHYMNLPEELDRVQQSGKDIPVYGTFLNGENIYTSELAHNGIVIMGNEGRGISADVERFVSQRILIPNYPQGKSSGESLNVAIASAIVCSEFRRRG